MRPILYILLVVAAVFMIQDLQSNHSLVKLHPLDIRWTPQMAAQP